MIGIDNYKDSARINSLSSAAADARALKAALVEAEGVPEANVKLLVSDANPGRSEMEAKPERNAILRALSNLAKNVKPDDTVFVFFCGHGVEKNGTSYLLPYDTEAYNDNTITDTAIDSTRFRDRLKAVHAGLLILAFDMCRNSPIKGGRDATNGGNTLTPAQVRGLDFAGNAIGGSAQVAVGDGPHAVVTLFSCHPAERSYEWIGKGRGYFSWFLEQGLRAAKEATSADGIVHVDTLTGYVALSVAVAVERDEGKTQTPLIEIEGPIEASHLALNSAGSGSVLSPNAPAGVTSGVATNDRHAYLAVAVQPIDASIAIDGVEQYPVGGRVAIDLGDQGTRVVKVEVSRKGYQPRVKLLTLARGTIIPFATSLTAEPMATASSSVSKGSASSKHTVAAYQAGASIPGLLHRYLFEGNARDAVGGANGTLVGGSAAADGVLTLDGASGYVQFDEHIVPDHGDLTVTLFACHTPQNWYVEVISQGESGPTDSVDSGFYFGAGKDGNFRATDAFIKSDAAFPSDDRFHFLAFVFNSTTQEVKLYVDEKPVVTFSGSIAYGSRGTDTRIGKQFGDYLEFFAGQMRDFRIYDRALSEEQLTEIRRLAL